MIIFQAAGYIFLYLLIGFILAGILAWFNKRSYDSETLLTILLGWPLILIMIFLAGLLYIYFYPFKWR